MRLRALWRENRGGALPRAAQLEAVRQRGWTIDAISSLTDASSPRPSSPEGAVRPCVLRGGGQDPRNPDGSFTMDPSSCVLPVGPRDRPLSNLAGVGFSPHTRCDQAGEGHFAPRSPVPITASSVALGAVQPTLRRRPGHRPGSFLHGTGGERPRRRAAIVTVIEGHLALPSKLMARPVPGQSFATLPNNSLEPTRTVAPKWRRGQLMLPRPVPEGTLPMSSRFADTRPGIVARESRWAVAPGGSARGRWAAVVP